MFLKQEDFIWIFLMITQFFFLSTSIYSSKNAQDLIVKQILKIENIKSY
jgi:hypothetical protein